MSSAASGDGAEAACKAYARYELGRQMVNKGALAEAMLHLEAAHADPVTADWSQLRLQLQVGMVQPLMFDYKFERAASKAGVPAPKRHAQPVF